jgi:hypothetical protein
MIIQPLHLRSLAFVVGLAFAVPALAHPGHGSSELSADPQSMVHYLTEPVHAVVILSAVALVLVAAGWFARHRSSVRA